MVAFSKDSGAQIVDTLRLSITGDCNLKCFYCKPLGEDQDLDNYEKVIQPSDVNKFVKIVGDLGVRYVEISGGEPLLRKDAANFIKSAHAHRKIENVRLVTNGTFLKAYADGLKKFGLRKVDINFDSLNFLKYQRITNSDSLYRVLDGIEKVEKLNFTDIRLNVLLLDGINNDEIVHFARFTKDRRVHVRFIEYTPVTSEQDPYQERENQLGIVQAKRLIENYQVLEAYPNYNDDLIPTFAFRKAEGKISFISQRRIQEIRNYPRVVLKANGDVINEVFPKKQINILDIIRKDPKNPKLRKAIEKVLIIKEAPVGEMAAAGKKKKTSAKKTVKKTPTKKRTEERRASAST